MHTPTQAAGALLVRLSLGITLFAHGLLKLLIFTPAGTAGYFASLGIPEIFAYLTIFGEVVGGAALMIGAYTRLAAIASLPILIGATWVHAGNGWVFSSEGGGWEFPLMLVVLAVAVALLGPGAAAIKRIPGLDLLIPAPLKD